MRGDVEGAQVGDMVGRVIGLVLADRDAMAGLFALILSMLRTRGVQRCHWRASPCPPRPARAGSPWWRGPYSRASPLGPRPCGKAGCPGHSCFDVCRSCASRRESRCHRFVAARLGAKALMRGPRFDQRAVHRKMLVRQQRLDLGMVQELAMNFSNTSPCCSRSRFLVKVVTSHTGSSGDSPTNQR